MKFIFLILTSSLLISQSSQFHPEEIIRWMEPTHIRMAKKLQESGSTTQTPVTTTIMSSTTTEPKGSTTPSTSQTTSSPPTTTSEPTSTPSTTTSEPTSQPPTTTSEPTTTTISPSTSPTSPTTTQTTSTTTSTTTTVKPTPPHCTPGQKKPVNGTCRDYVECNKTFAWVPKSCSTWCHNFNPQTSKCDWSWKYPCVYATTTVKPCTTTKLPIETTITTRPTTIETTTKVECTNGQKKLYKAGDCKDYLECDSGLWVEKSCSWLHYFDVASLSCKFSLWHSC